MSALPARFWAKVEQTPTCWHWTAALNSKGYGCWSNGGTVSLAHRVSYEAHVGPIPDGFTIDHLCRVKVCVNPAHLEPVTNAENIRRAGRSITHCPQGHEYTPENTRLNKYGRRSCKACARTSSRLSNARRRATQRAQAADLAMIPQQSLVGA